MSSVVRKSAPVVVRPSKTLPSSSAINLSSFDKCFVRVPTTVLLVFEHPIHEPAETIKSALSEALVHYYPISGRITASADDADESHIQCTGEGVAFVAASASCAFKEVEFFDPSSSRPKALVNELVSHYPPEGCGPTDPLLLMQVTEFSCGGFIVGVVWNHAVADGVGIAQFLQALGELARGQSSPSVVPVRWDGSLPRIPRAIVATRQLMVSVEPLDDVAFIDITVPSSLISYIRAEFQRHSNSNGHGQPCTFFEAVTAVLWQCRTRAIITNPNAPALLSFAADVRKLVGAREGYYGNCSTGPLAVATSGAVANGDIVEVVKMIRQAKDQVSEQFKKNNEHGDQVQVMDEKLFYQIRYNMFIVSSWKTLGLDKADFGGGTPARVMCYEQRMPRYPICITSLPCRGKDGASVFAACVKEEHADAFLKELATFI
ncbi:hypothetical protein SETIT_1G183200v2 [Setaria italica]|uniref:Uncharacterized protein n=1 Tax=Setaria italica TaxID=4555 RepID=K3YZW7_SETIT|nr:acyl transferase 15 [Setaria italica]RCV06689.1 hypothetical protein SETIT_1G183200v2 [Setaria italica]